MISIVDLTILFQLCRQTQLNTLVKSSNFQLFFHSSDITAQFSHRANFDLRLFLYINILSDFHKLDLEQFSDSFI